MSISPLTPAAGGRISRVRKLRPELVDAVAGNYLLLAGMVDPRCLELCRVRIAQILDDQEQLEKTSLDQPQLEDLANWRTSQVFGRKERACLEFAEQFLYSADAVTDEQVDALGEFFSPDEIWALTNAVAVSERFGRLAAFFETVEVKEDR